MKDKDRFERNEETKKSLAKHFNTEDIFSFNAEHVSMVLGRMSRKDEETAINKLHEMGYKLERFGEFSSGVEFASFIIDE